MTFFAVVWVLLLTADLALVLASKHYGGAEDNALHVLENNIIRLRRPTASPALIDRFDRYITPLTIAVIVYGFLLFVGYVFLAWKHAESMAL